MARKPIIAGNWKMHCLRPEAADLAASLVAKLATAAADVDVVLCPTFTALDVVKEAIGRSLIRLGAQNCHFEAKGAYTGEITAAMLKEVGCQYVILGHSERRQYFAETDEAINKKIRAAQGAGLIPIVCVGETLEERQGNITQDVVGKQVRGCLSGLTAEQVGGLVIAYEPVWAIGTGLTATKEQAQEVHAFIRGVLAELVGQATADAVRIQYGGSVKPDNIADLMAQPDIDGALVGGASLQADSFAAIVQYR